jgi:hypothetical protein
LRRAWSKTFSDSATLDVIAEAAAELGLVEIIRLEDLESINRTPSRFTARFPKRDARHSCWASALHAEVKQTFDSTRLPDAKRLWGALLLALVLRTGVGSMVRLESIIQGFASGQIRRSSHRGKVVLEVAGMPSGSPIRIYPDIVTDALCTKARSLAIGPVGECKTPSLPDAPIDLIVAVLKRQGVPSVDLPKTMYGLFSIANCAYDVYSSPICRAVASNIIATTSTLSACTDSWLRGPRRHVVVDSLNWTAPIRDRDPISYPNWMQTFKALSERGALCHADLVEIGNRREFEGGYARLVYRFGLHLSEKRPKARRHLKSTTIWRYLRAASAWLASLPSCPDDGHLDPNLIASHALAYDSAIENPHRRILFRRMFHHFRKFALGQIEGALPSIDFPPIPNSIVLGEAQFLEVCLLIERTLLSQRVTREQVAAVVTMARLSYRLGLRTAESGNILVQDIHVAGCEVDIVIRGNAHYSVKSDCGKRVIPADALMPPNELDALLDLYRKRSLTASPGDLLLHFGSKKKTAVTTASRKIAGAMKLITGIDIATQQHLRHSFASLLLVRLLERTTERCAIRDYFPTNVVPSRLSVAAWNRLVGGGVGANRGIVYAVQKLMGHASPMTTLGRYVHVLDEILAESRQRVLVETQGSQKDLLTRIISTSRSSAYRQLGNFDAIEILGMEWEAALAVAKAAEKGAPVLEQLCEFKAVTGAVALVRSAGSEIEEAARLFGVSVAQVRLAETAVADGASLTPLASKLEGIASDLAVHVLDRSADGQEAVLTGLRVYYERRWSKGAIAVIHGPRELAIARRILSTFECLNIAAEMVIFQTDGPVVPRRWSYSVEQRAGHIQKIRAPNGSAGAPSDWIGIRPRQSSTMTQAELHKVLRRLFAVLSIRSTLSRTSGCSSVRNSFVSPATDQRSFLSQKSA